MANRDLNCEDERARKLEQAALRRKESDARLGASTPDVLDPPNTAFETLALQLCWSAPAIEVIQEFIRQAELLRLDFAEAADRSRDEPVSMVEDAIRRRALEECHHRPASEVMRGLQHTANALGELVGLSGQSEAAASGLGQRL